MLKSYLKMALRTLRRAKLYSAINIIGLAIGLSVAILIGLWIQNELNYDSFNSSASRTYRVTTQFKYGDFTQKNATSAPPIAGVLRSFPSVQASTALFFKSGPVIIQSGINEFTEDRLAYADSGFFTVFSFKLLEGNPFTALVAPRSLIITESSARLLFPDTDPLGKVVTLNSGSGPENFEVTGVMEDIPQNSTFHFNMAVSMATFWSENPGYANHWYFNTFYNYFVLRPGASLSTAIRQLTSVDEENFGKSFFAQYFFQIGAQQLTSIHLHSHLAMEIEPNGNMKTLLIFLAVGVLILFIAIMNFVSLSTARYSDRAKEIGIRKVVGADRRKIVHQLMAEAGILAFISAVIAVSFTEVALPYFNALTDRSLSINFTDLLAVVISSIVVGLLAGSYPAYYLSSFNATMVPRRQAVAERGGATFRKGLVVTQFALAVVVLIATVVAAEQLHYLLNRNIGFNKNQVVVVPMYYQSIARNYPLLRNAFTETAGVVDVTGTWGDFGKAEWKNTLKYQGKVLFETNWFAVDYDFVKAMEIPLVSGRDFSRGVAADTLGAVIVNREAAQRLREMGLFDKPLVAGVSERRSFVAARDRGCE